MHSQKLVRGFCSLEAAAAAVNALVAGGVEHGAIAMRAAGGSVYLIVVETLGSAARAHAEQLLAGVPSPATAASSGRALASS